jgi:DNA-directed RNA polymerase subunit M/transcription elongation factor TFIIS
MRTSKIIDITCKKKFNCTECGFAIDVPPREITLEKLSHMAEVKKVSELLKKTGVDAPTLNMRILICPKCKRLLVCKDDFTDV